MTSDQRYDEVPYPGLPFVQTHPDRLATLGRLHGLPTPDPAACRVLEIGCGDGGNLIPMAYTLPGATFVGIDTSASAIAAARARAAQLELDNISFEAVSLADHAPPPGSADYVLAHGVYSWIGAPLREALLALCARALSEHGVAYVSYNALPGGRMRQALREILAIELEDVDDPAQKLAAARELLATLRVAWTYDEGLATLDQLAKSTIHSSDALLFHDALSPANEPLYFRDFMANAQRAGLQFVAEANFWEMQVGWLPDAARPALLATADRLRREQRLDFMRMRTFRQTLLGHAGPALAEEVTPERLEGLAIAAPIRADAPAADGHVTFHGARGQVLTTDHPLVIAALEQLGAAWPSALAVDRLWPPDTAPQERGAVCEMLLRCYSADLVTLHCAPRTVGTGAASRSRASAVARAQARHGAQVTNLRHESVDVDDNARLLITLLDGTRDRGAVRAAFAAAVEGAASEQQIAAAVEHGIENLARRALLLPESWDGVH